MPKPLDVRCYRQADNRSITVVRTSQHDSTASWGKCSRTNVSKSQEQTQNIGTWEHTECDILNILTYQCTERIS